MEDFAAGKFLVVIDDEDRENEGDLIMAADKVGQATGSAGGKASGPEQDNFLRCLWCRESQRRKYTATPADNRPTRQGHHLPHVMKSRGTKVAFFRVRNLTLQHHLLYQQVTTEAMAFMVEYTSGVVCIAMESKDLERLRLPQMVSSAENEDRMLTAFTITVDLNEGTTTGVYAALSSVGVPAEGPVKHSCGVDLNAAVTPAILSLGHAPLLPSNNAFSACSQYLAGISASDRAKTVVRMADPSSTAAEFRRPGHIFPLRYRQGGVIVRPGHTEASVDLARLAGSYPAGTCVTSMSDRGEYKNVPASESDDPVGAHDSQAESSNRVLCLPGWRQQLNDCCKVVIPL
jgi:3,4-dihydroxy-2-butanone 4-phosphate synthase